MMRSWTCCSPHKLWFIALYRISFIPLCITRIILQGDRCVCQHSEKKRNLRRLPPTPKKYQIERESGPRFDNVQEPTEHMSNMVTRVCEEIIQRIRRCTRVARTACCIIQRHIACLTVFDPFLAMRHACFLLVFITEGILVWPELCNNSHHADDEMLNNIINIQTNKKPRGQLRDRQPRWRRR